MAYLQDYLRLTQAQICCICMFLASVPQIMNNLTYRSAAAAHVCERVIKGQVHFNFILIFINSASLCGQNTFNKVLYKYFS